MAYEYMVGGRKISLPVNPQKVAVRFREPSDLIQRRSVIEQRPEVGSFEERIEIPHEKLTIVDVNPNGPSGHGALGAAFNALGAEPEVERVVPVFDTGSAQAVPTDRILVGFKQDAAENAGEVLQQYGKILQASDDEYLVQLPPADDPFEVIDQLMKKAEVAYAEPDFVNLGQHKPRRVIPPLSPFVDEPLDPGIELHDASSDDDPNDLDPLLAFQYAMRLTRANEAWGIVQASSEIKVAILDEGVQTAHPDLIIAVVGAFDATGLGSQEPHSWDGHGTACAGLAAARPNNALGIRGSGGGCSIQAARIAYSPAPGKDWITTNSGIKNAIDWARENGADILSNSWGGGLPSNAIINAFEKARIKGRSGKGCVIVVAAGNDNGPVSFPGTLPNVLTVSATNEVDEPKTPFSSDGESWWGSSFGSEVDVAAPGVHNYTTDITGAAGYNDGTGSLDPNYIDNFNGTSSATPIVAGIAALVLSVNPNLREAQVRRIIKQTADKVGQVLYTNGRNDRMGHGRVNALRAVQAAMTLL